MNATKLLPYAVPMITLAWSATLPTERSEVRIEAEIFPLRQVRIEGGPFAAAAKANREYLLALEPNRLLAPFLREAGLELKADPYGNWESSGLDGHSAGHYLTGLANMIAAGEDTPGGDLERRLAYMLDEMERCQKAHGDGYIGGVPESRALWEEVASGKISAHGFRLNQRWVPLYNIHKTLAGLRDAYLVAGMPKAKTLLVGMGDWCIELISDLTDRQVQDMLRAEHGGMNEVLADLHAITGERKYLDAAERYNHRAILDPLMRREDRLTGEHANTQIPKVVGLARMAALAKDDRAATGARFFWEVVTRDRSIAFGGNSVREHFNPVDHFRPVLEDRQGPETCNTYNMLRLTERLFVMEPQAAHADYYERALYNHILSAIHPREPGYVYLTPIRPNHYRVYSEPDHCFWCCVGTGFENPGKYGEFIYAKARDGIYVNLFIPSELTVSKGVKLRQETNFPFEERSRITMELAKASTFKLRVRHPVWVGEGAFEITVNGEPVPSTSKPSSYVEIRREWKDGDVVDLTLPMSTSLERLPDGSDWAAILHGPIVLAARTGAEAQIGRRAGDGRMEHIAHGPLVPLDRAMALTSTTSEIVSRLKPDPEAGPLHFRLREVVVPEPEGGVLLEPFFSLHDARYQMYWQLSTPEQLAALKERLAAEEKLLAAREAETLDSVNPGEQQPEVEHGFQGGRTKSGMHRGRMWRDGEWFQYTLDTRGESKVDLEVTYWGGDRNRVFEIYAGSQLLATERLRAEKPGEFFNRRYPIPADVLARATEGGLTIRFVAKQQVAGGVFDVRLMRGK